MTEFSTEPRLWAAGVNRAADRCRCPPAVVLGAGPNGLACIRSLGRRGIPVFALDANRWELGMHSRFAEAAVLSDPVTEPERWIEFLAESGRLLTCRAVVMATGDPHLRLLADGRAGLESYYRLAIPPTELITTLVDKLQQYRVLLEAGAKLPKTYWPVTETEALEAGQEVGFPCIVKPAYSHLWFRSSATKLGAVSSPEQLGSAFRAMAEEGIGCVVQELIPGGDDSLFGFLSYWDLRGRLLAWCTKRKMRQYPAGFGNGSYQMTVTSAQVAEESMRLLRRLYYAGFASVEYKHDARDGHMKLIEINPRTVSGLQMAIDAGVDLPCVAYCDLVGEESPAAADSRTGVRFINESWEVQRFWTSGERSPLQLLRWLHSLALARSFAVLSIQDPGPAVSLVRRAVCLARK